LGAGTTGIAANRRCPHFSLPATGRTITELRAAGPVSASINSAGRFVYVGTGIPAVDGGSPGGDGLQAFTVAH
jgi:hypothetical protein